jgi:polyferredoxin
MRSRLAVFVLAALIGGLLGYAWNWPLFGQLYKGFIALFADTGAPVASASAAVLLAFIMGVPRICVP